MLKTNSPFCVLNTTVCLNLTFPERSLLFSSQKTVSNCVHVIVQTEFFQLSVLKNFRFMSWEMVGEQKRLKFSITEPKVLWLLSFPKLKKPLRQLQIITTLL